RRLQVQILPVQIEALRVLARVQGEAGGIEAWTEPDLDPIGPAVLLNELVSRQRAGGFISVNARRDVDSSMHRFWAAASPRLESYGGVVDRKQLGLPTQRRGAATEFLEAPI